MKEEIKGLRFNEKKPRWGLVPQSALVPMVRVLEYGTKKYAPWNWTKGLSITETCESLKRHLDSFMEGEDYDRESKIHHIGHIQCNALFISWYIMNKPECDDRHFKSEFFSNPNQLLIPFEDYDTIREPIQETTEEGA